MAIIGVSGKIGAGKDLVGKIIQYLVNDSKWPFDDAVVSFDTFLGAGSTYQNANWKIVKFANKLKECVSLILNIPREDLEKIEVKNSELPNDWCTVKFKASNGEYYHFGTLDEIPTYNKHGYDVEKMTVRTLLQKFGTEVGRSIHSNFWVNALFSEYKIIGTKINDDFKGHPYDALETEMKEVYPNWIITDMRFENELEAIKSREGITIRVNRGKWTGLEKEIIECNQHPSETALDNATFDYVLDNNGTIEELIVKVEEILIKERIL